MKGKVYLFCSRIMNVMFILITVIVFFMLFFCTNVKTGNDNVVFDEENIINIDKGWNIKYDNVEYKEDLPIVFDYKENRECIISKKLDEIFYNSDYTLYLMTDFSEFKVYLDDVSIYTYVNTKYDEYKNLAKGTTHNIDLSEDYQNKELKIVFKMKSNNSLTYFVKDVFIGDKALISNKVIFNEPFRLIILLLLIIFSIVSIFIVIMVLKYRLFKVKDLFYIAIFSIISTIYVFSESNLCSILIDNNVLVNYMTHLSILIMPIPLLFIIADNMNNKRCGLVYFSISITIINFVVQIILNATGIYDFRKMLVVSQCIIVIGSLFSFINIFINYLKYRENIKGNVYYILPMSLGAVIDIILFRLKIIPYENLLFQIGVIILIIFDLRDIALKYSNYYMLSIKTRVYKNIAYTDILTKVGNRTAYEDKIDEINNEVDTFESVWCISIDTNNLKVINDSYGHLYGDKLIKGIAKILNEVFLNYGDCYRIGGDEFVIFVYDISEEELGRIINLLYDKIEDYNNESDLNLSIALGYDNYKKGKDNNILDVINRSDMIMYENKKLLKELERP